MDNVNTNIDLGSNTQTQVNTSSSINNVSTNPSPTLNNTNTSNYQTYSDTGAQVVEEIDLTSDSQPKSLLERAGDWLADVGKSIYDTGASVVEGVKSWAIGALKGAGATLAETAANLASNVSTIGGKIGEIFGQAYAQVASTGAVVATTITSGVGRVLEKVSDGLTWLKGNSIEAGAWVAGKAVSIFNKDAGDAIVDLGHQANQRIKEWIAVDQVAEANKWFYENTELGKFINEHSLLKYDSEAAQKIQGITEKAAELAAATALTVFTGGAATFAVGALYGMGQQAESTYQKNGTETSLLQEAGIVGAGALTGLSWMANGKLGAGFLEIGKTAAQVGVKEVVSQLSKDVISKDFWAKALKEGLTGVNGVGNYVASAMMTGEDILPYLNGEKEWNAQAVGAIALSYLKNLGLNVAEDALRGYVGGFDSAKAIDAISSSKIEGEMNEADLEKIMGGAPPAAIEDASKIDAEADELAFFNRNKGNDGKQRHSIFSSLTAGKLTPDQQSVVNQINSRIKTGEIVELHISDTTKITKEMLAQVDDLSKVRIKIDSGFLDINGNPIQKYFKPRYVDRVTYTGNEALSIISRLDDMQSKIDMNLPIEQRARQIYELIASEYSYMTDYDAYADGHKIAASLRGLTTNNSTGKEGLVCAGFAQTFKELCTRCGIQCDYISGTAYEFGVPTERHAWNIIINEFGETIPVDVTWKVGGGEWFGNSKLFAETHVADSDEMFKDYNAKTGIDAIKQIISIMDSKYGSGSGLRGIKKFLDTGDPTGITRTDGARDILTRLNPARIAEFLDTSQYDTKIQSIIQTMNAKYGYGAGIEALNAFLVDGRPENITRTNGARDLIQSIPLDAIRNFLNSL